MNLRHPFGVIAGLEPAIPIDSRECARLSGVPGTNPGMAE